MNHRWFAHPGRRADQSDWHGLVDHLKAVANDGMKLAEQALPGNSILREQAQICGYWHDLGKFRQGFQDYLKGISVQAELRYHKQAGALLARQQSQIMASFVIAGHHGGIPDLAALQEMINSEAAKQCLDESKQLAFSSAPELFVTTVAPKVEPREEGELLTRLLFSILVDADGTDTGRYESALNHRPARNSAPLLEPEKRLETLLVYLDSLSTRPMSTETRTARNTVLNSCLDAAQLESGLFTLRVPTGGGKTLAGLAFALKHAAIHGKRRVIIVAPYLTILEQTALVIRRALNLSEHDEAVLEHHSLGDWDRKEDADQTPVGRKGERWDCPIVITSNVQFFESLFSNKPGRCRKVHQIAQSVVLLDECQSLPPGLQAPTCTMLNQIAESWGATIVLMTATQPGWQKTDRFKKGLTEVREIIHDPTSLYKKMVRARINWPEKGTTLEWGEVALAARQHKQALTIVNTLKAARDLFTALSHLETPGLVHLSTALCPLHRRKVLDWARMALRSGEPCQVVSTQVIEAGVDIDFPVVFREMGPLDAILQAAGRCNREGLLPQQGNQPAGRVEVFRSIDGKLPSDRWYKVGRSVLETIFLAGNRPPSLDDPLAIEEYFRHLQATGDLDEQEIDQLRFSFQFAEVADRYKLIDDSGVPVVIASWSETKDEVECLLTDMVNREFFQRKLVRHQVNMRYSEVIKRSRWITEDFPGVLVYRGPYDDQIGLLVDETTNTLLIV